MNVEGPNSRFPFSAGVEGQTSRAHSSTEAEVSSLDRGMRDRGDPSFCVWETIFRQYHQDDDKWRLIINLHEDNTTCIITARTGKNATMKTLEKCFGVNVGWIYQRIKSKDYNLYHTGTKHMCADIYTKAFSNSQVWNVLRRLINVFTAEEIQSGDFNPDVTLALAPSGTFNERMFEHFVLHSAYNHRA